MGPNDVATGRGSLGWGLTAFGRGIFTRGQGQKSVKSRNWGRNEEAEVD